jgi:hypothetical protein
MILHGGIWHIGVNMYGLYILGPFVEALIGSVPFFAIYFFAGLTGAGASLLVGRGELSVGASGAIMGLLGAIIVLVVLRRGNFPDRWRRVMLWNLAILVAVQIGIDFASPMIDNAAHVGGMIGGAIATLLFAPGLLAGSGRLRRALAGTAAVAFVVVAVISLVQVVRTPLADTLARLPQKVVQVRGIQLTVPREWEVDAKNGKLVDPDLDLEITVSPTGVESQQQSDPRFRGLLDRVERSARPR